MFEVKKYKNGHNFDVVNIKTNDGEFQLSFQGNLDLYWDLVLDKSILNCENIIKITITKENYFFYETISNLFNAVKNKKPYSNFPHDTDYKNKVFEFDKYSTKNLFKNNRIEWHSDDEPYDISSILYIEKKDDSFIIKFEKSKTFYPTFSIRIRTNGSFYGSYFVSFVSMYKEVVSHDFDDKQIHIEEYLYEQKKLVKTR